MARHARLIPFIALVSAFSAHAEEEITTSVVNAPEVTEDASELALPKLGPVTLSLNYTTDFMGPVSGEGAASAGALLGAFSLGAETDLERAASWKGARLFVQGLAAHGGDRDLGVGDLQGTSSILMPPSAKLLQLWVEQNLAGDRLSLLAGLHDLCGEFNVSDSAAVFLNGSFGTTPELSYSGINGPPLYPQAALAARVLARPTEAFSVRAAIYNAVAGEPAEGEEGEEGRSYFDNEDGALGIGELGYDIAVNRQPGRLSVGAWSYTQRPELPDTAHRGVYVMAEQRIYSETQDGEAGLTGFARAGMTDSEQNAVYQAYQVGLSYRGPWGRAKDEAGVGLAAARGLSEATSELSTERTFELTYKAHVFNNIFLQPDLQWVSNPGLDEERPGVWVGGLRAMVQL